MSLSNQTAPVLILRGKEMPIHFVDPDRKLNWGDLRDDGSGVTNDSMDAILIKDGVNIILLLSSSTSSKLRKHVNGGISNEWMHNYSIFYIMTSFADADQHENVRTIDYRAKNLYNMGRLVTGNSNIHRMVNNSRTDGLGTDFLTFLNHTVPDDEVGPVYLFELRFGQKRG